MSSNIGIQDAFVRWDSQVSSPFTSLSRRVYPRTVREVFSWAEELWLHHGIYSRAIQRAVRYFMTSIEITGEDLDYTTRQKYIDAVNANYDIMDIAASVGDDYLSFGNSFTSYVPSFQRILTCPRCAFRAPLSQWKDHYTWEKGVFKGSCPIPSCAYKGSLSREDISRPERDQTPNIVRWPPQHIEIKSHPITKKTIYTLRLDNYDILREGVLKGDHMYLEETPWDLVEAIIANKVFDFEEDAIFHMAHPTIAAVEPALKGWGMPPFMAEFETALLIHLMDKYTEAIIVDYLMPFRVLSPPHGGGEIGDPMLNIDMGDFKGQVNQMISRHRRNPTDWNFLPVPLEYQTLGGEAAQLAPIEIQEHFERRLLHSMGIPDEFIREGGLSNAGPLLSLKMFERSWQHFANDLNKFLTWIINKQGEKLQWERVEATLVPATLHEDPETRDIKMQLAAAGEISKTTAYRAYGIDYEAERRKVKEEQEREAEAAEEEQKVMDKKLANSEVTNIPSAGQGILEEEQAAAEAAAQQQGGGGMPPPAPSAPPAGGGNIASIDELVAQGEQIAQQLLVADHTERVRTLSDLQHSNEALYAQVKSTLAQLESSAKQQGLSMVRQGQMPAM